MDLLALGIDKSLRMLWTCMLTVCQYAILQTANFIVHTPLALLESLGKLRASWSIPNLPPVLLCNVQRKYQ